MLGIAFAAMLTELHCSNVSRAAEKIVFHVDPGFRFSPPEAIHIELLRSYGKQGSREIMALSSTHYAPFSWGALYQ
jgi:hypothetical protein